MAGGSIPAIVCEEIRICVRCADVVPAAAFPKVGARCKPCRNKYAVSWRRKNPEATVAQRARAFVVWREKNPKLPEGPARTTDDGRLCGRCKKRFSESAFFREQQNKGGRANICKECSKERRDEWLRTNKERVSSKTLIHKYGVSRQQVQGMFDAQNGDCPICEDKMHLDGTMDRKRACVDHCHVTGRVRGLLCRTCNSAIGMLGDGPEGLERAILYLRRSML